MSIRSTPGADCGTGPWPIGGAIMRGVGRAKYRGERCRKQRLRTSKRINWDDEDDESVRQSARPRSFDEGVGGRNVAAAEATIEYGVKKNGLEPRLRSN